MPTSSNIVVSTIAPSGYSHVRAFDEVTDTLCIGLSRLGFSVQRAVNSLSGETPNILLGAHLLDADSLRRLPEQTILYNLEQVDPGAPWVTSPYVEAMAAHEVWDFNEINVRRLQALNFAQKLIWAPIGYVPELTRIPKTVEDIDVLFYGSINDRRAAVIQRLQSSGLKVVHVFGVYGAERDTLIARSKVVLNVHFYESGIFEWVRIFYLLANFKTVVSEVSRLTAFDQGVDAVVKFSAYDELVDTCRDLVDHPQLRESLASNIPAYLQHRNEETILRAIVQSSLIGGVPTSPRTNTSNQGDSTIL